MNTSIITRQLVADNQRVDITAELFGSYFPFHFEPFVYDMASQLAQDYDGGYWNFYTLSNSGFYMAPNSDAQFHVIAENDFEGDVSSDALGIIICAYAFSNLSFGTGEFAHVCAVNFHRLREFALDHPEAGAILAAID